ncbi:hypothetical protein LX32DRAFT_327343 [Colletotrichum zoysiae]|uniref:Uncharacterized protein n=1 Tax=Colletotrichum zoysiae TaxID=1216348 RepID=A0AAD9H0X3_9PEZI|nr:hypothetical protein LX32DRAFT_327343 [Colletotrichum zoysiae]
MIKVTSRTTTAWFVLVLSLGILRHFFFVDAAAKVNPPRVKRRTRRPRLYRPARPQHCVMLRSSARPFFFFSFLSLGHPSPPHLRTDHMLSSLHREGGGRGLNSGRRVAECLPPLRGDCRERMRAIKQKDILHRRQKPSPRLAGAESAAANGDCGPCFRDPFFFFFFVFSFSVLPNHPSLPPQFIGAVWLGGCFFW